MAVALAASTWMAPGVAQAQDDQGMVLDTITVTAQFREQNLQQTPLAITAVNADTMEARSQTSIDQVAAQAPSVSLAPRGAAYGPSMAISIRGVGQSDFNPAYEPGVGLYVDDVYYPTLTGSILDLLDLDRVEILRGPQGTLAGRNSIGGAVKLYSKTPVGDNTGYVESTYGSRNRIDLRASADIGITDSLSARLSGVSKRQDGYVERRDYGCLNPESGIPANMSANTDCVTAKEGEINYDAVRGILHWDNGGPVRVTVIGDYTNDDRTGAASVLLFADDSVPGAQDPAKVDPTGSGLHLSDFVPDYGSYYNYASYTNEGVDGTVNYRDHEVDGLPRRVEDGRSFFRSWGVSGKVNWDLSDTLNLESITAYRQYSSGFSNDNDMSPLSQQLGNGTLDFWSFSEELRLNGSAFDNAVDWTLGGFYMDQRSTYGGYQDLRFSIPPFQQDDPIDADSKAVFAHVNWFVTNSLSLIGGLRYTDESKNYHFVRIGPDGGPAPEEVVALNGEVGRYSGDHIDYRLALQYQWTDNVMTYIQTATGFKGGGVNPRPFIAGQVQPFGQEKLTSYEVGAKTEMLDRRLRLNVAAFYSDYTDIQLVANSCPQYGPGPCALPINGGSADVYGVELEGNFEPVDGLLIDASAGWLDFEYRKVNPAAAGVDLSDVTPFTPEWKGSAGIQYTAWLDENNSLTPRFDISYQDHVFTTGTNSETSRIRSYTLANARLTWRNEDRGWEAALQVTNIFDKYYLTSIYDAAARSGVAYGSPGRPREWAVTLKKSF